MKRFDVVVIGGSIGGVLAAYRAARSNKRVLLTERTPWIGGQFTNQAVPPDEHRHIEDFGATRSYLAFRNRLREHMKDRFPILDHIRENPRWNPGHASVSRIAAPPKVFLHLFYELINPYLVNGNLTLMTETEATDAIVKNNEIESITIRHVRSNMVENVRASYFIDATDTGELFPLTGTEYVTGAESTYDTGEANAPDTADPKDMQPVTWVAAVELNENGLKIEKPDDYDLFKSLIWPCGTEPVLSMYGPDSTTGRTKRFALFDGENEGLFALWSYRRILVPEDYEPGFTPEISLINWPQNDYFLGNLFDDDQAILHAKRARNLTKSLVYWLQNEAPNANKKGYPMISLRTDVLGTDDGLALAPYIRESRRLIAEYRITEKDIGAQYNATLPHYADSVGIGSYPIDLHMTTRSHRFTYARSWPFEIPLGSFIPIRMKNLIPASKNIGTTQLTNGCYRLHPVEWNIGEVAGLLASEAIDTHVFPKDIRADKQRLSEFQKKLDHAGITRHWPDDVMIT
jgi:hypothetical protein